MGRLGPFWPLLLQSHPLSPTLKPNLQLLLSLRLPQSPTMDMDTVVDTMAGMAIEDTGERRNGLLWLSLMQLLSLNLMDMATTGLMDTGVGEGRRDLLSPMLRLNLNLTDMDIAPMATTGPMGTGAGERRKGLPSPTMAMDMDTAVATMAVTVADTGAKQKSEQSL